MASKTKRIFFLLVAALLPLACSIPQYLAPLPVDVQTNPPKPRGELVLASANSTPTATPFQPLSPTATYLPTQIITATQSSEIDVSPGEIKAWGDYPGPTLWPEVDIPPPTGLLPKPSDQVNILLLGSDQRPYSGGFRTDTILLATLNPGAGSVSLTSFPRDLYVYIPGWTVQRLNTAHAHGGFEQTALAFEYNFGVRPDYFILINFSAFQQTIDSLGGISVNVGATLTDHRDGYGQYTVTAGLTHMDGETALWYVRARYSTSDFDRTRRQQEVIQAMFLRLLSLNAIKRAPELFEIYRQNVTTNITLDAIAPLLPLASQVGDSSNINQYYIGPQQVTRFFVPSSGADVLLPIRSSVLEIMSQAISNP